MNIPVNFTVQHPTIRIPDVSAIENNFQMFDIGFVSNLNHITVLNESLTPIREVLLGSLSQLQALKFFVCYNLRMTKDLESDTTTTSHFHSGTKVLLHTTSIDSLLQECKEKVFGSIEEFTRRGSGWVFLDVEKIELFVTAYKPTSGASYILLPPKLNSKRRHLLNIKNTDNRCLKWCLLAGLYVNNPKSEDPSDYQQYESNLDFGDIEWPAAPRDITKVEKLNDIRINLYGYDAREKTGIFPLYISCSKSSRVVSLLLISDSNANQHYVLIKDLDGLLRGKTKHPQGMKHCHRCLQGFSKIEKLNSHVIECENVKAQRIQMPLETAKYLEFTNIHKQMKHPIYIVADFECLLMPTDGGTASRTTILNEHVPCGYAYKVMSYIPGYSKPVVVHRGVGCEDSFIDSLVQEYDAVKELLYANVPLVMTADIERDFASATICHICEQAFLPDQKRVHDHNHYTGDYVGAAHEACNLNYNIKGAKRIPVIIHNLKNYDSHLFIKSLVRVEKPSEINVIASTTEKFTRIDTQKFSFIDSYQHLPDSLDTLVSNLKTHGTNCFKSLTEAFPNRESFNLMLGKGVYPYSYMDSWDKFDEPLPERDCFFNDLSDQELSENDYNRVVEIFNHFNLQTLGDLHDLYVKQDVLLLADVIENYREMCLTSYKLDPLHYPTAPSLSWDACLRYTRARLELLTDVDMYLFVEKGIRGGLTMITHRMATANNSSLREFEQFKEALSLLYIDANNLYGWAMSLFLPYDGFEWVSQREIDAITEATLNNFDLDGAKGMILEVDLLIPDEIHDLTSDYPLAPEPLLIKEDMISPISKSFLANNGSVKDGVTTPLKHNSQIKLTPNLFKKEKYVVHVKNLVYYLSKGVKLEKIHRILRFNQCSWIKPYVEINTQYRRLARSEFEKAFFKLLINSVFGKLMENVRKYRDVHLISNVRQHRLYTSRPQFKRFTIHSEDLVMVELNKTKVQLNKPIYCGFTVLDLSKLHMYKFHYDTVKHRFPEAKLCFTDTDSLLYAVPTDDIYRDLEDIQDSFDFSNYPRDHRLYSDVNKSVPGYFKDETASIPIKEFIGMRAKQYSIRLDRPIQSSKGDIMEKRATSGVKKSVASKHLCHDVFRETFLEQSRKDIVQHVFECKNHKICTARKTRIGVSAFDDKRYILDDLKTTLPYGHYRIRDL